jgi:hypothetical protein
MASHARIPVPSDPEALRAIAQSYFDGLGRKDLSRVPYAENATLRAPLNPDGGSASVIRGRSNILAFLNPLLPALGEVKVIRHFVEDDWVATRADVGLATNPNPLRVIDAFRIENGQIVEQENHYDPRPALGE